MKRHLFVIVLIMVLCCAGAISAGAQFRLDISIAWPIYAGINFGDLGFSGGTDIGQFLILLPMVDAAYQFGEGPLRIGVGAKAGTFIIESLLWPNAYVEMDLDPIVIRGDFGGFLFLALGRVNEVLPDSVTWVVPQVDVGIRLTDWFRLSGGAIALAPFNNMNNFGFLLYVNARFIIVK